MLLSRLVLSDAIVYGSYRGTSLNSATLGPYGGTLHRAAPDIDAVARLAWSVTQPPSTSSPNRCRHTHAHTHSHIHTLTHSHTRAHTHTHTHTQTHKHTGAPDIDAVARLAWSVPQLPREQGVPGIKPSGLTALIWTTSRRISARPVTNQGSQK